MSSTDLNVLKQCLRANTRPTWAEACNCDQLYSPKNLSMALSGSRRSDLSLSSMWLINKPSIPNADYHLFSSALISLSVNDTNGY